MTNTTTSTKLTKREQYAILSELLTTALENELINEEKFESLNGFIAHEVEMLDKKNAHKSDKPTANQVANDSLREEILEILADRKPYTVADMIKTFPCCAGLSSSKVSAVLRPLLTVTAKGEVNENGVIERYEEKGKAYFKLA